MYAYTNPPLQTSSNFYLNVGQQPALHNNYYHHQPVLQQQRQTPSQQRRRKAIPRPWLVKKEQRQQQQQQQPKESLQTSMMTQQKYQTPKKQSPPTTMNVEVWADEPSWTMSLSKLVSCWYCIRPNGALVDPSPKKTTYSNNRLLSQLQQQQHQQHIMMLGNSPQHNSNNNQNQPQAVPFPAFPAFRRHSSESLFSYELQGSSRHVQQPKQNETWTQTCTTNVTSNGSTGVNRDTSIFWGDRRGSNEVCSRDMWLNYIDSFAFFANITVLLPLPLLAWNRNFRNVQCLVLVLAMMHLLPQRRIQMHRRQPFLREMPMLRALRLVKKTAI